MPGNIFIPAREGCIIMITRDEPFMANESLGIQLTLTGNQDDQQQKTSYLI